MGVIGFHPAALPNNRGRHPIIWALALGLNETASTFFKMDEGADTGDIVSQVKIPICESDYAADLYENIMCAAKNRYWNLQKTWKMEAAEQFHRRSRREIHGGSVDTGMA